MPKKSSSKNYFAKRRQRKEVDPERRVRSGFEGKVMSDLDQRNISYEYESIKLRYIKKQCPNCGDIISRGTYTPDLVIVRPSGIPLVVEIKGRWTGADREKHKRVKRDNPEQDIRFVFQRDQPIRKGSATLYSDWCINNNFQYTFNTVPDEWIKESSCHSKQKNSTMSGEKNTVPSKKKKAIVPDVTDHC